MADAFNFFQQDLIGNALDIFYNLVSTTLGAVDPALTKTMSNMQSVMEMDDNYIEKLIG